ALDLAGAENLSGKIVVDVTNPLDLSRGFPPTLSVCNTDSLGETIQRNFPQARVVKTLCTVNADEMVDPALLPGAYNVYLSGNEEADKQAGRAVLESNG